ncbi:hypothetical protein [Steroidobacter sp.]|uniref:hypothetical protein n=1 Tax=Steroidobacter sp. TaxID=1978227 RepID=UPI001A594419|nr:hypothetical protein [Steroidobacter sp.]MBL8266113.1 hypothetical protein [Steroidobacter sp.]
MLAAVLTVFAQVALAQSYPASAELLLGKDYRGPKVATPRDAQGKPLLTGYWKLLHEPGKPDGNLGKDLPKFKLPYSAQGQQVLHDNLTKTVDPEARCIITGIPRLLTSVLPFEILHTPKRLGTFHALSWHRWVWLDGRKQEEDPDPEYLGNAIGAWDGDTLVIDSVGFRDSADGRIWLDDNGNPQSVQAHVVERWSRPDFHHLNLTLTYTDPLYYTKPVTYKRSWVLGGPGESLKEFSCEWNTPWIVNHLEPGPGVIGANGNRGYGPNNQLLPDLPFGSVDSSRGTAYWLFRPNKPKPSDVPPPPATAAKR